jgi:thymidine phosphorylase
VIIKKRDGGALSREDPLLRRRRHVRTFPDYQASALLMAVLLQHERR